MNFLQFHSKHYLFFLNIIFLISSCGGNDDPNPSQLFACFEAPEKITAGMPVQFNSDCSENETSYQWDFGGLGASTSSNPSFTFTTAGSIKIMLTVGNGEDEVSIEKTITVETTPSSCIEHKHQIITEDETWKTGETHCIYGQLSIKEATLTIEPGVTVELNNTGQITVGYEAGSSTLVAIGTADNPIIFTSMEASPAPGDWIAVSFFDGATDANTLKHCVFEYGGSQIYSGSDETVGMIELQNEGTVTVENCTFRNALTHAAKTDSYSGFASFSSNTISNVGSYAISTSATQLHTLGTNNNIENKGILAEGAYVDEDVTWLKQTCPYYFDGGFAVGSSTGNTLTLSPGLDLRFLGGSLGVGVYGHKGKLVAVGTDADKITFSSGEDSPAAGDWRGLEFGTGTMAGTQLAYTVIKHATGNATDFGAVTIQNSNVSIDNTEISDCQGMGIDMDKDYYPAFASFTNNVINTPGGYPLHLLSRHIGSIGEGNSFISEYPVPIVGERLYGADIIWRNVGVPYLIDGDILVGADTDIETSLTIEAGCVLKFTTYSGLVLFTSTPGVFKAIGTEENPIVFTSSQPEGSQAPGDWDGIEFYNRSKAGSVMEYCHVLYGGGYGNIYVNKLIAGEPVIKNCTISHSSSYGIRIVGCSPTLSNNTFSNNASGDVGVF